MINGSKKLVGIACLVLLVVVFSFIIWSYGGGKSLFKNVQVSVVAPFSDVDLNYKYQESISFLKENGVVVGHEDGSFSPDSPLTRAEFTKIVVLGTAQDVSIATEDPFSDVPLGKWYTNYIDFCARLGYVTGYSDGTFRPDQEISKVGALKILGELVSWDLDSLDMSQASVSFKDVDLKAWYGPYLYYASEMNIIDDVGDFFDPGKSITRGQMAEYIYRDYVVRETGGAYEETASVTSGSGVYADCSEADKALSMLQEEVIANEPNKNILAVYQKPESLKSGDYFQVFSGDDPSGEIKHVDEKSWFFWINLNPGARFGHDTEMVTVAFDGCASQVYESDWWPVVNGEELWSTDVEQNSSDDLVYYGIKADINPQVANLPDPVIGPCNAPADSRKYAMIVFFGDDRFIKQDAVNMNKFLCDKGYLTVHIDNNIKNPLQQIEDQIRTIAEISQRPGKSLNSFFFYVTSHGNKPETGDLVVRMEDDTGPAGEHIRRKLIIPLVSLADIMSAWAFGTMYTEAYTFVHDTCFSGNAVPLYQQKAQDADAGVVGWVSVSSKSDQVSLADDVIGSDHTNALMNCLNNILPYANFTECVKGVTKDVMDINGDDYDKSTPLIEKLTPETGDFVPFLP